MKTHERTSAPRRGFTLLDLLIGLAMLGTFMGSLLVVAARGADAAREGLACQTIEALARRTLDRMASELASAGAGTLDPNPTVPWGSDDLTFRCISGYGAGAVQWTPQASFSLELDTGELDDGVDNDGDGSIDERMLVYTRDPAGAAESFVLAHGVSELLEGETANGLDDNQNGLKDEAGLSFERAGAILRLRLSLEELDARGETRVRTVETSVRLRN